MGSDDRERAGGLEGSAWRTAKVAVLFETNAHASRASQALHDSGLLGVADVLVLRRGKPWGDRLVPTPRAKIGGGLGAAAVFILSCVVLMTCAADGLDAKGLASAIGLGVAWGALYGVLVGALSGSTTQATFFEQFDPPTGPDRGTVEVASQSHEVLARARRHLLCCAGAIAERLR